MIYVRTMGKISNYRYKNDPEDQKSIDKVKEDNFNYKLISKSKDFEEWYYNEVPKFSSGGYIFRGVNEAKYKLYTSLQRTWWNLDFVRGLYGDINDPSYYLKFVETLMNKARGWNYGILARYYKKLNTELDDFALLSLMQHYGLPTPLLDFTTDLDTGLYFAFLWMEQTPNNRIIENCVSLYILSIKGNQERLLNLSDIYKEENQKIDVKHFFNEKKLVLFSEQDETNEFKNGCNAKINTHTNFNILNQKGVFLFNYHPWKPIEVSGNFQGQPFINEAICIDIHKSLKQFILKILNNKRKELNHEYLFPNFNHFRDITLTEALQDFPPLFDIK